MMSLLQITKLKKLDKKILVELQDTQNSLIKNLQYLEYLFGKCDPHLRLRATNMKTKIRTYNRQLNRVLKNDKGIC